jgi:predicted Zn-ribbon and HTH transcriptional regulator
MLFDAPTAFTARTTRSGNGIDNQQVLEFLRLAEELKRVAALLAIEPARCKSSGKPHSKQPTSA